MDDPSRRNIKPSQNIFFSHGLDDGRNPKNLQCSPTPNTPALKGVNILYLNIQCLISQNHKNKLDYINEFCQEEDVSIIALTETWLREEVSNEEISIPGYSVHRSDRISATNPRFPHGGVALYARNDCVIKNTKTFSNGLCDALAVTLTKPDLQISIHYRPPKTEEGKFREALKFLEEFLAPEKHMPVILLGDFNFPKDTVQWERSADIVVLPLINPKRDETWKSFELLLHTTSSNFLAQQLTEPSRKDSYLDLGPYPEIKLGQVQTLARSFVALPDKIGPNSVK
jgi:exonuclease III